MDVEQLLQLYRSRPFRPFRIHMAGGRKLEVLRSESLACTPSRRTLLVAKPDETFEVLSTALVISVELLRQ